MSVHKDLARWAANDDQRLQLFREFYSAASAAQQQRMYEYVRAVAALAPSGLEDEMRFAGEIGCTGDRFIDVQVRCHFAPDDRSASISPRQLQLAIEAWRRGEEYAPSPLDQ